MDLQESKDSIKQEAQTSSHIQVIKAILDFVPVALLFGLWFLYGFKLATFGLVGGLILQTAGYLVLRIEVPNYQWVFIALGLVFGGLTLALDDSFWIKLRPTVVSGLIVTALLVMLMFKKLAIKSLLGKVMHTSDHAWRGLTLVICCVMTVNAIINLVIVYGFGDTVWLTYKAITAVTSPLSTILACYIYMRVTQQDVQFTIEPEAS